MIVAAGIAGSKLKSVFLVTRKSPDRYDGMNRRNRQFRNSGDRDILGELDIMRLVALC